MARMVAASLDEAATTRDGPKAVRTLRRHSGTLAQRTVVCQAAVRRLRSALRQRLTSVSTFGMTFPYPT